MKHGPRTVVIITSCFPYAPGEEFIEIELPYLASAFDRVVIVPTIVSGRARSVPKNVEVETGFAFSHPISRSRRLLLLVQNPLLLCHAAIRSVFKPLSLRKALRRAATVASWKDWLTKYVATSIADGESVLFFSWWMTLPILGVRLANKGKKQIVGLVSRAHGYDLYVEERPDPNWPFHERVLKSLDHVFVVSAHGLRYLIRRYPWMASKAEVGRLGVEDCGMKEPCETLRSFVVCSCAYLNPVKRVDLLIRGLACVGAEFPAANIQWHHFGDGPLLPDLQNLAQKCLPKSVLATFHGRIPNSEVRSFYRNNYADVFINTSSSEGVPVSIMEAQSAGIPVIASAVGGTPELVNESNGWLLPPNPEPGEIANAISNAIREPGLWREKRTMARQTSNDLSTASTNYRAFIEKLQQYFERWESNRT
jgi:glycosyltransferase involved in cell wall biosynthesis